MSMSKSSSISHNSDCLVSYLGHSFVGSVEGYPSAEKQSVYLQPDKVNSFEFFSY